MSEVFSIPSRLRRLMAYVYEALPVTAILFLAAAIGVGLQGGEAIPSGNLLFQLYLLLWLAIYFIVCWTYGGQTAGMRAWRLHIVSADGSPLRTRQMMLRFFVAALGWLPAGAGHLWLLVDDKRRTVHDIVAGTLVIQEYRERKKS